MNHKLSSLLEDLHHQKIFEKRKYIPDKLAKIGNHIAVKHLGNVLINENEKIEIRNECAESIGKIGHKSGLKYLEIAGNDSDSELRRTIIWSIGQIGDKTGLELLKMFFNDQEKMCQRWIPKSIARIYHQNASTTLQMFFEKRKAEDWLLAEILSASATHFQFFNFKEQLKWVDLAIHNLKQKHSRLVLGSLAVLNVATGAPGHKIPKNSLITLVKKSTNQNIVQLSIQILRILNCKDALYEFSKSSNKAKKLAAIEGLAYFGKFLETIDTIETLHEEVQLAILNGIISALKHTHAARPNSKSNIEAVVQSIVKNKTDQFAFKSLKIEFSTLYTKNMEKSLVKFQNTEFLPVLIRLFPKFPLNKTHVEILKEQMLNGDKRMRQIALRVIIQLYKLEEQKETQLSEILQTVVQTERTWHIRRDARKALFKSHNSVAN